MMRKNVLCLFLLLGIAAFAQAQSLTQKSWDFQYGDAAFTEPYVDVDEWRDRSDKIESSLPLNKKKFRCSTALGLFFVPLHPQISTPLWVVLLHDS